jgi:hypothetical protein
MFLVEVQPSANKPRASKNLNSAKQRKYFNSCLSMGFAQDGDETSPRPVCVLCNEVLQSTSSVLSKSNRHSEIQR